MTEITPLGDCALIVRIRDSFRDAPTQTTREVLRAMRWIAAAQIPGIIELAPAYTTVAIYFDPVSLIDDGIAPDRVMEWLTEKVNHALQQAQRCWRGNPKTRSIEVPVCFDSEFAFDLDQVAQHANIPATEVANLYCAATYHVGCIGFTPGFPFLMGLPPKLATPRRASPRKEVPAGSVGIGGEQTGIYPLRSPGGWNLIGRTPLKLFDPMKSPPSLLQAGDRVRFRAIERAEFENVQS
jgi:inhibitor of KinA